MQVYYDKDCDLSIIQGKTVAIIGYGSQGHAHANNLKDSGVKTLLLVCARAPVPGPRRRTPAWKCSEVADAVKGADVVMVLLPDENQPAVYASQIEPNLKEGAALAFAHGFNIHYGQIAPRKDLDVIMIAPKGPGHTVRSAVHRGLRCARA